MKNGIMKIMKDIPKKKNDKIIKWLTEDYIKYIQTPKPKGKYNKKKQKIS